MHSDDKQEQELRLLHVRFIGKILAGFTHETKNYLAIINESAGLMGDMLQMGKSSEKDVPEYLQIIRSVEEQIQRANNQLRSLNRFAHRMDAELASYNVNESLEELIALLTRFANQKKITLIKSFQDDLPSIYGNPSLLQFVVFSLLDEGLAQFDKNSSITIKTALVDQSIQIRIIPEGKSIEQGSDAPWIPLGIVERIMKQLKGNFKREGGGETLLMLPLTGS